MIFVFLVLTVFSRLAIASEPTVLEVQQEAIRYLGFDQREMDGWKSRARWAAALPKLQVGFDRDLRDVVSLTTRDTVSVTGGEVFIGPDQRNFDQDFNQVTSFEVKAVWDLDALIFSRDSLAVSSEKRDWVRERSRTLQDVTEAYFTRKRLLREVKGGSDPLLIREKKKFLLDQASGTLDAYTGGWYSRRVENGEGP